MDPLDLVARLTLLLLILYAGRFWYLKVPMTLLCTCGVLFRSVYRSPMFWLIVSVDLAVGNFLNWYRIDNHKFLMTYWCVALHCALSLRDPARAIAGNARVLIGLCFAFAVLWKVITPDFSDGTFFHYSLLQDRRFTPVARAAGGMTPEMQRHNRDAMKRLLHPAGTESEVRLQDTPLVSWMATGITWWTIGIESLIAVLFLLPGGPRRVRIRNGLLILFAASTYPIAPVVGFGWLLMVMGAAQCGPDEPRTRLAYVAAFFAIQIFTAPWKILLI